MFHGNGDSTAGPRDAWRVWLLEIALGCLVFVLAFGWMVWYLPRHQEAGFSGWFTVDPLLLSRAVPIGAGKGWQPADYNQLPEMHAFVHQQTPALDPSRIPHDYPVFETGFEAYHRYLSIAAGLMFRLFGISWRVYGYFMAVLFAASILGGYLILRLCAGRWLALAGAAVFMLSPAMLVNIHQVRAFSKVPFLLCAAGAAGFIALGRHGRWGYWALAGGTGLLIGVGMGFRQDAFVCVVPAIAAILLARGAEGHGWRRRCVALLLFAVAFGVPAYPLLSHMGGDGEQPYHPLVQGFSTNHLEHLIMRPAPYTAITAHKDNYTYAALASYDSRVLGEDAVIYYNSPEVVAAGKAWVTEAFSLLPGDVLTRAFAAVRWSLTDRFGQMNPTLESMPGAVQLAPVFKAFWTHMHHFGFFYLVLCVLCLAAHDLFAALVMLALLLFFAGYPSIAFQYRHTFHLSFVPIAAAVFTVQAVLRCGQVLLSPGRRGAYGSWTAVKAGARRVALAALLLAALLGLPWWGAATVQDQRLTALAKEIDSLPRTALPVEISRRMAWSSVRLSYDSLSPPIARPMYSEPTWPRFRTGEAWKHQHGRLRAAAALTMFQPHMTPVLLSVAAGNLRWDTCSLLPKTWRTNTAYLALELENPGEDILAILEYEGSRPEVDFSHGVRITPPDIPKGAPFRYFFPVYELYTPDPSHPDSTPTSFMGRRNAFRGILLPPGHADVFRGLYVVERTGELGILPSMAIGPGGQMRPNHWGFAQPEDGAYRFRGEDEAHSWYSRGHARSAASPDEAMRYYELSMQLEPGQSAALEYLAPLLLNQGRHGRAEALLMWLIREDINTGRAIHHLSRLLAWQGDPMRPVSLWRGLVREFPGRVELAIPYAEALLEVGETRQAAAVLRVVKVLGAHDASARQRAAALLQDLAARPM